MVVSKVMHSIGMLSEITIVLNVVALRKTFFTYFANLFALKLLIKKPGGHQYSDTSLTK